MNHVMLHLTIPLESVWQSTIKLGDIIQHYKTASAINLLGISMRLHASMYTITYLNNEHNNIFTYWI